MNLRDVHLSDPCLFFVFTDDDLAIVCLYVDDLLLCTSTLLYGHHRSAKFHKKFKTNDLGEIKFMLGMRVTISLCRSVVGATTERARETIGAQQLLCELPL